MFSMSLYNCHYQQNELSEIYNARNYLIHWSFIRLQEKE